MKKIQLIVFLGLNLTMFAQNCTFLSAFNSDKKNWNQVVKQSFKLKMKIDKIKLDHNNRMIRIGFGKHDGNWFFRIDLWYKGYRIKK